MIYSKEINTKKMQQHRINDDTKPIQQYKYNEKRILDHLQKYIDNTYTGHYSQNKIQATEFIIDSGHGDGFCIGNIMKYAQRYGKKCGRNEKDLLKIIHYTIMLISTNHSSINQFFNRDHRNHSSRSTISSRNRSRRSRSSSRSRRSRSSRSRSSRSSRSRSSRSRSSRSRSSRSRSSRSRSSRSRSRTISVSASSKIRSWPYEEVGE